MKPIKVIDLFAGPGGLGEGFSSFKDETGNHRFKIALSIEKESEAHKTLLLRAFFRQFNDGQVPEAYYDFVRKVPAGNIEDLFKLFPKEASKAKNEAWQVELGKIPNSIVDNRIKNAIKSDKHWVLIGGPPCQAYSIVGRSRRQQSTLDPGTDDRVYLYKEYLRILAVHRPPIFIMENVKGLLSAEVDRSPLFQRILDDLSDPYEAIKNDAKDVLSQSTYNIFSLAKKPLGWILNRSPDYLHGDYVIKAEDFGIPQTRHRVILLGVRNDISKLPDVLTKSDVITVKEVIGDLPRLRSGLSKQEDNWNNWSEVLKNFPLNGELSKSPEIQERISTVIFNPVKFHKGKGGLFLESLIKPKVYPKWFADYRLRGVLNHESRSHMDSDIHRYLFSSCFASINNRSPKIFEFPKKLLPKHLNIMKAIGENHFGDRFRVQVANKPAKTITSHISKDGHYYIHFDPSQCRSLTVREAARIQTFPDNYFFCGNKTAQYIQVGNAVPPLLALKISELINNLFK